MADDQSTPERPDEDAVSEEEAAASELEADLAKLTQVVSERDEYLDTLRRVQAEFENYRKRVIKEQTALVDRATSGLVEQLLPVLDSFELALKNLDSAGSDDIESVRKGVELVYAELLGVLEKAVMVVPGATALTVMPSGPTSRARWRVKPTTPALAAA